LVVSPGVNLVLRFDWATDTARAFWDTPSSSPRLIIRATGVTLGEIEPLEAQRLTTLKSALADQLKAHLMSSSFVTVAIEGEADAVILVDEEGAIDKPSLLTTLSPEEILRFWSLLTDAQKQEFFESHAGELDDEELARWMGDGATHPHEDSIFGTFAHVYLSFANLERAVRQALAESRHKEAVDRLFGKKFDSVRRLVEKISEKPESDPVRNYVTLLCAIQLLDVLRKEAPEFYAQERRRFDLMVDIRAVIDSLKARFNFSSQDERQLFFEWFEQWFLRRASPAFREVAP
jgi:hypothetical protein